MQITIYLSVLLSLGFVVSSVQDYSKVTIDYIFLSGINDIDSLRTTMTKNELREGYFEVCFTKLFDGTDSGCYELGEGVNQGNINFISKRTYSLKNRDYIVYKYLFNDPNIADEEEMYFYNPKLGVILYKNLSWGGYGKVYNYSNNKLKTNLAIYLCDKIITDDVFFMAWRE